MLRGSQKCWRDCWKFHDVEKWVWWQQQKQLRQRCPWNDHDGPVHQSNWNRLGLPWQQWQRQKTFVGHPGNYWKDRIQYWRGCGSFEYWPGIGKSRASFGNLLVRWIVEGPTDREVKKQIVRVVVVRIVMKLGVFELEFFQIDVVISHYYHWHWHWHWHL